MKKILNFLFAFVIFFLIAFAIVSYYLSLPTVYISFSAQECVKVETKDGPGSCDRLPNKYHRVWVK